MDKLQKAFPAELEDVDTIITAPDGKDYVVDVIAGLKQWVLYNPDPDDVIEIEKVPFPEALIPPPKKQAPPAPKKSPTKEPPKQNRYQIFVSEQTVKLKLEQPNLSGQDRLALIRDMWKHQKDA